MVQRSQVTYYGTYVNDMSISWGGTTFHSFLLKDYVDTDMLTTGSTSGSLTLRFLYPYLIETDYDIEGVGIGHFKVYNLDLVSAQTVTDYTVALKKTDLGGNTTTTIKTSTLTVNRSIPAGDYVAFPIGLDIYPQKNVTENERFYLEISMTAHASICFSHENGLVSGQADVEITIPMI